MIIALTSVELHTLSTSYLCIGAWQTYLSALIWKDSFPTVLLYWFTCCNALFNISLLGFEILIPTLQDSGIASELTPLIEPK